MIEFVETGRPPRAVADDHVLPFAVEALDARGRVVRLGPVLDAILSRHDYPTHVAHVLAEAIALTALLGSSLKFEGRFTLQTKTDGPVSMLVVDFSTPDSMRAYASFDAAAVEAAIAAGHGSPAELIGRGHLAMTVDQGPEASRYQGFVTLDGQGLEEAAHGYFQQSEQIPTKVRLAVGEMLTREPGQPPRHTWRAGGIVVQFLPAAPDRIRHRDLHPGDAPEDADLPADDDDAWTEASSLAATVSDVELTDPGIGPERLLFRLFHERGVRVFSPQPIADRCRCTRERVAEMLGQFSADDVSHMTVDGKIEVTCEFCSTRYTFDPTELK